MNLASDLRFWSDLEQHLFSFTAGLGPAIRSITHLEIDSSAVNTTCVAGVAALLYPLAAACPGMKRLTVTGNIGRAFLAAVGTSCLNLSCLVLVQTVPLTIPSSGRLRYAPVRCAQGDTLRDLHQILPFLTHVRLPVAADHRTSPDYTAARVLEALQSCLSLTCLDLGLCRLPSGTLQAFPPGLRVLRCFLGSILAVNLKGLENLWHLTLYSYSNGKIDMLDAVAVLRVAPHLRTLTLSGKGSQPLVGGALPEMPHMILWFSHFLAIELRTGLVYFQRRVSAGLAVNSTVNGDLHHDGVMLLMQSDPSVTSGNVINDFLAYLSPLPAFISLTLRHPKSSNFPEAIDSIAEAFPNLTSLAVDFNSCEQISLKEQSDLGLACLDTCTSLRHLNLSLKVLQVSTQLQAHLCNGLSSLEICFKESDTPLSAKDSQEWMDSLSSGQRNFRVVLSRYS